MPTDVMPSGSTLQTLILTGEWHREMTRLRVVGVAHAKSDKLNWVWLFLNGKKRAQFDHFTRRRAGCECPCTGTTFPLA